MCKNNDIYNYDLIMIRITKYIYIIKKFLYEIQILISLRQFKRFR